MKSFRLIACREDGTLELQTVDLAWNTILRWESDEESMAFCFEYSRNEKPPRWVKVYTPYVSVRVFVDQTDINQLFFFFFFHKIIIIHFHFNVDFHCHKIACIFS